MLTPFSAGVLSRYLRIADYAYRFEWPWTNWRSVFLLGVAASEEDLENAKNSYDMNIPVDEPFDEDGQADDEDEDIEDWSEDDSDSNDDRDDRGGGGTNGRRDKGKGKSKDDELDDDPNETDEQMYGAYPDLIVSFPTDFSCSASSERPFIFVFLSTFSTTSTSSRISSSSTGIYQRFSLP